MKKKLLFVLAAGCASFLIVGLLSFVAMKDSESAEGVFMRKHLPVRAQLTYAFAIGFDAFHLQAFDRNLYTCDLSLSQIIQLDTTGREVARFGKKGVQPGDGSRIIGWGVDATGLYAADPSKGTITLFNRNGAVGRQYKFKSGIIRAMRLAEDQYVVKSNDETILNENFQVVNISSGQVIPIDGVYQKYNDGGFATDGFFVRSENPDRKNVHVSHLMGNFFCFNDNGKVAYKASTIDGHGVPPEVIRSMHNRVLAPQEKTINKTAAADGKLIYIVSNVKSNQEKKSDFNENSVVDVYDLSTGKYSGSFYIPDYKGKKVSALCKVPDGFYAVQGRSVTHYKWDETQIIL